MPDRLQRDVAEDVDVVDEDGLGVVEEGQGLDDAATGVHQQPALIGEVDLGREGVAFEETDDLVAEVVYVDDDGVEAVLDEVLDIALEQGLSSDFDEGLGLVMG